MTQEELVQKCNITLRTIQRIEAGETTPRTFTIKTILNALGYEYEKVFEKEYKVGKFDKILRFLPSNFKQVLKVSFVAGIIYFIFGFFETAYYTKSLFNLSSEANWYDLRINNFESYSSISIFILIKIVSIVLFTLFMRGFVLVGSYYKNYLIELMSFLMIIVHLIFEISEIVSVNFDGHLDYLIWISRAVTFGIIMVFFGLGIFKLHLGNLPKVAGVFEILTGICFANVFLSAFGLILLIPLELLEILILHKVISKIN